MHELGHFATAKWFGVRVEEFGMGIPPRAKSLFRDKSGTEYTLNWLPIGGFVRLKGEDPLDPSASAKDSLTQKSYFAQSTVILAGVVMNFFLAWVIFAVLFTAGISPLGINTKFPTKTESLLVPTFAQAIDNGVIVHSGVVLSSLSGSIAEKNGVLSGSILKSINGTPIKTVDQTISLISSATSPLDFELSFSGKTYKTFVLPQAGKIGAYVSYENLRLDQKKEYSYPFTTAMGVAGEEVYAQSRITLEVFFGLMGKIFTPKVPEERQEAVKSLSGPVALGGIFVDFVHVGVPASVVFVFMALVSINLGVFNLLPLPALDGGRFFLLSTLGFIGKVLKKPASVAVVEKYVHTAGFVFLILVSLFVAYQDIVKLVTK